jgi:hypothetical protein
VQRWCGDSLACLTCAPARMAAKPSPAELPRASPFSNHLLLGGLLLLAAGSGPVRNEVQQLLLAGSSGRLELCSRPLLRLRLTLQPGPLGGRLRQQAPQLRFQLRLLQLLVRLFPLLPCCSCAGPGGLLCL